LNGPSDFDLSAAGFRRSESDLRAFMEAFALRMESALPSHTVVQRKRDGLFSKQSHVASVSIETANHRYVLSFQAGRLAAERSKVVRGVTLKNEPMEVPAWLESLGMDVEALANHSGSAQNVLHDFLMS
jgi:hypothetical protein